jgi:hypothetical protein
MVGTRTAATPLTKDELLMHYALVAFCEQQSVEDTIIGSCLASERITGFHTHFIGLSETDIDSPRFQRTDAARPPMLLTDVTSRSLRRSFITSVVRKDR